MQLVKKYGEKGSVIAEIGGNLQGKFKHELEGYFDQYYSFDINRSARNEIDTPRDMPEVNIMVSYYVFEHVVDVNEFIELWSQHLSDGGFFIIEVPDVNIYYRDMSALALAEHVNHFTPQTLTALMNKHGFSLEEINRESASRSFGFVGVYKKAEDIYCNIEYKINKGLVLDGLRLYGNCEKNLKDTACWLHDEVDQNGLGGWHYGVPVIRCKQFMTYTLKSMKINCVA